MNDTYLTYDPARPRQAEAVIDLTAIRSNVEMLKTKTSANVMAVVKADGYGHGIIPAAYAALAGGATWLGVCTVEEAQQIRQAGITVPILAWLFGPNAPIATALKGNVDLSVANIELLDVVLAAVRETGITARLHLKLDTGLGRGGAQPGDWLDLVTAASKAQAEGSAEIVGIWSHFAHADIVEHPTTERQLEVFADGLAVAERAGLHPDVRHTANSAATLTLPAAHYDLVRTGISIYGLSPIPHRGVEFGLKPAMTLHGQVVLAKRVPARHGISYNHTYVTERESTVALVALGYADGIPRILSNRGPLQLAGSRFTIAGRVSMDQIMVDVGDTPVHVGDLATLFGPGNNGEPTADDWAEMLDTIPYEVVSRIGPRVPRVYKGLSEVMPG